MSYTQPGDGRKSLPPARGAYCDDTALRLLLISVTERLLIVRPDGTPNSPVFWCRACKPRHVYTPSVPYRYTSGRV